MDVKNIEMKWQRNRLARSCLALLMVMVMVVGNVGSVEAGAISALPLCNGLSVEGGFHTGRADDYDDSHATFYHASRFSLTQTSGSDSYLFFTFYRNPDSSSSSYVNLWMLSKEPFSYDLNVSSISGSDSSPVYWEDISLGTSVSSKSSKSLSYNGVTYYYRAVAVGISSWFTSVESNIPIAQIQDIIPDYNYSSPESTIGLVFEKVYNADLIWQGGSTSAPDLSTGAYSSSLGYLENMKLGMWNLLNEDDFPVDIKYKVSWDNTRPEFDDSYRVAHYVKVHATFQMKKDLTYESDRIFVNDVPYTDCSSSFINSEDLTSTEEYQTFISEMDERDKDILGTYITEYEHNLIIYRETDDGLQYGYWNVLKLDEYGDGYVGSYLRPSYGVEDAEGNYVPKEEGDILGEFEYGQGSSFEDAEDNTETLVPEEVSGFDDIGKLFDNFFSVMTGLFSTIGDLPRIVGDLFTFLPSDILALIGVGLTTVIILRILGR